MTAPVFTIQATDQESLERMPDLFINSLEESVRAMAGRYEVLEAIRVRLINLRAEVDNLQADIRCANWRQDAKMRQEEYL